MSSPVRNSNLKDDQYVYGGYSEETGSPGISEEYVDCLSAKDSTDEKISQLSEQLRQVPLDESDNLGQQLTILYKKDTVYREFSPVYDGYISVERVIEATDAMKVFGKAASMIGSSVVRETVEDFLSDFAVPLSGANSVDETVDPFCGRVLRASEDTREKVERVRTWTHLWYGRQDEGIGHYTPSPFEDDRYDSPSQDWSD